ncbi:hypothetical protein J6524_32450 [Bradyrhizobium sp. WSM 1738]|uniref:hypothetical protein n=1 Tax=Bradyrhizobium hereditatis TaxID=2821405 RepID=UPI001CE275C9|nr:hypothetical protein [Bradyrhizobium hereditatis]MCA6119552.1 hypothetical protein [Bradyrhizobium hereditatis]
MRAFIAISVIVASVSSASAQSAMDPDHAAAAARAARAPETAADARAAATASGVSLLPSQQTNFYVAGRGTMKVMPRTAEELTADEAGQAAWNARCRPTVVEDSEGLRRVRYAERDCDLSRFNTAGN